MFEKLDFIFEIRNKLSPNEQISNSVSCNVMLSWKLTFFSCPHNYYNDNNPTNYISVSCQACNNMFAYTYMILAINHPFLCCFGLYHLGAKHQRPILCFPLMREMFSDLNQLIIYREFANGVRSNNCKILFKFQELNNTNNSLMRKFQK